MISRRSEDRPQSSHNRRGVVTRHSVRYRSWP